MKKQQEFDPSTVTYLQGLPSKPETPEAEILALKQETQALRLLNKKLREQGLLHELFQAERDASLVAIEKELSITKAENAELRTELSRAQTMISNSRLAQIKLRHVVAVSRRKVEGLNETNQNLQALIDQLTNKKRGDVIKELTEITISWLKANLSKQREQAQRK